MAVFAQHGWGKGSKIDSALTAGDLQGVILGPRDESVENMRGYITRLRDQFAQATILIDPQFYASTTVPLRGGHLEDYPHFTSGLQRRDFLRPGRVRQFAEQALTFQAGFAPDRLVSPSILFSDFAADPWSQIALTMAGESIAAHQALGAGASPLLLSVVVDESAFKNRSAVEEFLDLITEDEFDCAGLYLIVRRSDATYPALVDESWLANYLYFVYVLSELNSLEIHCGYGDFLGAMAHACGATSTGAGWYNNLRDFSLARFQPSSGGRRPLARYTSEPLINSVLVVPELSTAHTVGVLPSVLSGTNYDRPMATTDPANSPWSDETSCLHHWAVLNRLTDRYSQGSISARLDLLESDIARADATYRLVRNAGVIFTPQTGPRHLHPWSAALERFRAAAGV